MRSPLAPKLPLTFSLLRIGVPARDPAVWGLFPSQASLAPPPPPPAFSPSLRCRGQSRAVHTQFCPLGRLGRYAAPMLAPRQGGTPELCGVAMCGPLRSSPGPHFLLQLLSHTHAGATGVNVVPWGSLHGRSPVCVRSDATCLWSVMCILGGHVCL